MSFDPLIFLRRLVSVVALAGIATAAQANGPNLVSNGSFSTFTTGAATGSCSSGTQTAVTGDPTGWTITSGYSFIVNSSNYSSFCGPSGTLGLYGPIGASPDGGNFLASDGGYLTGYISQPLTLVTGATYSVSFYVAGAQQSGYTGATTDYWTVGLGNSAGSGVSQTTPTINLPSATFSGWSLEQFNFVAQAASQVLWFLATGSPSGQPPFSLLDGVTTTQVSVPEPPTALVLLGGLLGLAGLRRVRRSKT